MCLPSHLCLPQSCFSLCHPKGLAQDSPSALSKKPFTTLMDQSTGLEENGTRLKPLNSL